MLRRCSLRVLGWTWRKTSFPRRCPSGLGHQGCQDLLDKATAAWQPLSQRRAGETFLRSLPMNRSPGSKEVSDYHRQSTWVSPWHTKKHQLNSPKFLSFPQEQRQLCCVSRECLTTRNLCLGSRNGKITAVLGNDEGLQNQRQKKNSKNKEDSEEVQETPQTGNTGSNQMLKNL